MPIPASLAYQNIHQANHIARGSAQGHAVNREIAAQHRAQVNRGGAPVNYGHPGYGGRSFLGRPTSYQGRPGFFDRVRHHVRRAFDPQYNAATVPVYGDPSVNVDPNDYGSATLRTNPADIETKANRIVALIQAKDARGMKALRIVHKRAKRGDRVCLAILSRVRSIFKAMAAPAPATATGAWRGYRRPVFNRYARPAYPAYHRWAPPGTYASPYTPVYGIPGAADGALATDAAVDALEAASTPDQGVDLSDFDSASGRGGGGHGGGGHGGYGGYGGMHPRHHRHHYNIPQADPNADQGQGGDDGDGSSGDGWGDFLVQANAPPPPRPSPWDRPFPSNPIFPVPGAQVPSTGALRHNYGPGPRMSWARGWGGAGAGYGRWGGAWPGAYVPVLPPAGFYDPDVDLAEPASADISGDDGDFGVSANFDVGSALSSAVQSAGPAAMRAVQDAAPHVAELAAHAAVHAAVHALNGTPPAQAAQAPAIRQAAASAGQAAAASVTRTPAPDPDGRRAQRIAARKAARTASAHVMTRAAYAAKHPRTPHGTRNQYAGTAASRRDWTMPAGQVQQILQALGLYQGPLDGAWSPALVESVKVFQRNTHLAVDGFVGRHTQYALMQAIKAAPTTSTGGWLLPALGGMTAAFALEKWHAHHVAKRTLAKEEHKRTLVFPVQIKATTAAPHTGGSLGWVLGGAAGAYGAYRAWPWVKEKTVLGLGPYATVVFLHSKDPLDQKRGQEALAVWTEGAKNGNKKAIAVLAKLQEIDKAYTQKYGSPSTSGLVLPFAAGAALGYGAVKYGYPEMKKYLASRKTT